MGGFLACFGLKSALISARLTTHATWCWSVKFESLEALEAYAVHPEHLRVKEVIGDMRTSRHQVDYFMPRHVTPVEERS